MKFIPILLLPILCFISCSREKPQLNKKENNQHYDKAFYFLENEKPDSAFLNFSKARDLFLQQKDSLGAGKCLVNMAIIAAEKGDYLGSQEISLNALAFLNEKKEAHFIYIESNYNNLGFATHALDDSENALKFYDNAIKFSRDPVNIATYLNNKAKAYQELKNYDDAIQIYTDILAKNVGNEIEYARALTNISTNKWLQNPHYNPAPEMLKALRIREKNNDKRGLNSSYAHLADYYAKSGSDSALYYAKKRYQMANIINITEDKLAALQILVKVSPPSETKKYFEKYQRLSDSTQKARTIAKNQFALVRYETEKSKLENLNLQKDNTEKKYQLIKKDVLLFSTILLLIIGSIIAVFWYKKRTQLLNMEAQNSIRENQLKTSKKVHDVVANGLYRVMTEVENQHEIDKEAILDRLDHMYQKSRDISYEVETAPIDESFHNKLNRILKSFNTQRIKITIKGNTSELWKGVNAKAKHEVEQILQELMVNMKKHSSASEVEIRFVLKNEEIKIFYRDNGIGILKDIKFNNGLKNTGTRIEHIHGEIIFDTTVEKGLKIQITFPVFN